MLDNYKTLKMNKSKLTTASGLFLVIIILWPVLAFISIPNGENYSEQIESIRNESFMYILNFIVAFLIAPAIIYMLFELYKILSVNTWTSYTKLGFLFYGLYFITISISYASQFLYIPFIIDSSNESEIIKWYFFNNNSLAILFNQTGYLIWSIVTMILFTKYLFKSTLVFFIIKLLMLSSLTQITATLGFYFNIQSLTGLSFYSGILLLPTGILIFIYSFKNHS